MNTEVMTFLAWDNEYQGKTYTAIALCDRTGYFYEAINCMRDGSMGEKDKNGVFDRHWYADNVNCYGDEAKSLRPATKEEVDLYLDYCPLDEIGTLADCKVRVYGVTRAFYGYVALIDYKKPAWYKRLWSFLMREQLPLPF